MSNKVFDFLKYLAMIGLPAIATFTMAIMSIWNIPYCEQVVGTITAIDALLGALLGISSAKYKKGVEADG